MCIRSIFSSFNLTLHHILDSIWKENSSRDTHYFNLQVEDKKTAYTFRDKILQWLENMYSGIHFFSFYLDTRNDILDKISYWNTLGYLDKNRPKTFWGNTWKNFWFPFHRKWFCLPRMSISSQWLLLFEICWFVWNYTSFWTLLYNVSFRSKSLKFPLQNQK